MLILAEQEKASMQSVDIRVPLASKVLNKDMFYQHYRCTSKKVASIVLIFIYSAELQHKKCWIQLQTVNTDFWVSIDADAVKNAIVGIRTPFGGGEPGNSPAPFLM